MAWFRRQVSAFEMQGNLDEIFEGLVRRRHWRKIGADILRRMFANSRLEVFDKPNWDVELIRGFIFVSEQYGLVKNNFVPIGKSEAGDVAMARGLFATTLYRLGSDLAKAAFGARTEDEIRHLVMMADMAFTSSLLCDPLMLPAYGGIALLYGTIWVNKEVALEWCSKYKEAEAQLASTPDRELTSVQLAGKRVLDPKQRAQEMEWAATWFAELVRGADEAQFESMRHVVEEVEKQLLKL